ncbi:MAG: hypothetical protein KatS3mg126_0583 [Lysobacteraceae bacterium]|nr:MAG: hypothetical protein KatS3mg126_0583 [Xanthomonadaceae bacterium]
MLTQCPHCATVYPVEAEQLLPSAGRVRCGVCGREFDALERLRQETSGAETPRLDPQPGTDQGDLFAPRPAAAPAAEAEVPSFAQRRGLALGTEGLWWLAAVVLALLLCLQIGLAERHRLALDPALRGGYELVCGWLGCSLPPWREPRAWQMLSREIGPHPSEADGLLVTATLRNGARWAQPLPWVELSLADLDGKVVARRRFAPAEYHHGEDSVLLPGQTTSLQLEIVDPGSQAMAFEFEFL